MNISVMTLFPHMIESYMSESIMKRAIEKDIISVKIYNIRDFSENKHKKVDDYPFGGGAGMVMTPQPIYSTFDKVIEDMGLDMSTKPKLIYLSPKGRTFDQEYAKELSKEENLVFLCGHYEGIDQRIIDSIVSDEFSIGDYVLTGGELPAMVMIDSISRLIPGVLGTNESFEDESFENDLLEYPHYTRPRTFNGMDVPDVIISGNHKKIDEWRLNESKKITQERRPDLWKKYKNREK
ncbi:tRNA (guanosine(37)-N1)-methyltransferase TrmD [Peptostreptococcus equinus]|uniref:tRNA (guanine-N(1)-)-methyltransferase n=1 Tax=Peptostreptococcus equinus TaxID=3003601 RepID=A0ABY7JLV2_9FIRM|nr:tRNA (guanosine(37)-N1)-methyltransferase TrmD [Peptostreptococcus sp. CBA3647]WAW14134.1 tRNA (guanosine(37)-N1)-methyltransferase TrmD [Peptostreptococcus sp. CBA3647]